MFLWDFALRFVKSGRVLEVGGGSGVLGLLLARERSIELSIVEKQERMANLCRQNAKDNQITATVENIDFLEYTGKGFDFVVSNPPFYPSRVQKSENDSLLASRYADELPLDAFLQKSKKLLKPNGEIIFCYDARELQAVINEAAKLKGAALTHIKFVHAKTDKVSKLALFRIKNSSRTHLEVLPPLVVMNTDGYSDEAKRIFSVAACDSVDI
jgi:tRNA1(Val) A37 N6-methylase TrmN6